MPRKSKEKWYVVFEGRKRGIYSSWDECSEQVNGFKGAKYKSYSTKEEAEKVYSQHIEAFPLPLHEDGYRYEENTLNYKLNENKNEMKEEKDDEIILFDDRKGNRIDEEEEIKENETKMEEEHIESEEIELQSFTNENNTSNNNQNEMNEENDEINEIGLRYKEINNIKGLYRNETNECILEGEQSIELFRKGLLFLFYSHWLEVGYKLYLPSNYSNQLFECDLPFPLKKNLQSFIIILN